MMNRLQKLYEETLRLKEILEEPIQSSDRDTLISKVNEIIEKREVLMEEITPPFTNAEKELGKKVVALNEPIQERMQVIFNSLKKDIQQMKKQKRSNMSYTNPYKNVNTMDGMFLDNKL